MGWDVVCRSFVGFEGRMNSDGPTSNTRNELFCLIIDHQDLEVVHDTNRLVKTRTVNDVWTL